MFDFIRDDRFTVIEQGLWLLVYPFYALLAVLGLPQAIAATFLLSHYGWRRTVQDICEEVRYQFIARFEYLVLEASDRGYF